MVATDTREVILDSYVCWVTRYDKSIVGEVIAPPIRTFEMQKNKNSENPSDIFCCLRLKNIYSIMWFVERITTLGTCVRIQDSD